MIIKQVYGIREHMSRIEKNAKVHKLEIWCWLLEKTCLQEFPAGSGRFQVENP
jgi:hypothetical protein